MRCPLGLPRFRLLVREFARNATASGLGARAVFVRVRQRGTPWAS